MTRLLQVPVAGLKRFANPAVVCEGWYPVAPSRAIPRGGVKRVTIGERDLVVYREREGALRALDPACGHLGADLSRGRVVERGLQCAFHAWCWGPDGACAAGGGVAARRRVRAYDAIDRWGLAWVWAGERPRYDLPEPEPANREHVLRLPPQRLRCHPHVMLGNGLDLSHVGPVHGFRLEEEARVEAREPDRVVAEIHARFGPSPLRRLLGLAGKTARWTFTTIGPSLAWVKVTHPTPFELVWAGRPLPGGGTATQTIFFLPRWRSLSRALPMMTATTWADRAILNTIDFRPGFVPSDAVFARYAEVVEGIPEWTSA